jgi:hypothetical protein
MAFRTMSSNGTVSQSGRAPRRPSIGGRLNPTGDLLGDLAPTVVESTTADRLPFAVWSHPNGADYDLVFSGSTAARGRPCRSSTADNLYNDLDPGMVDELDGAPVHGLVPYRAGGAWSTSASSCRAGG